MTRRFSVSEARRLLPRLVREVATDGGRIDITYRGKPQVSLLRVSDVKSRPGLASTPNAALKVELRAQPDELLRAIHGLRESHLPRASWLDDVPKAKSSSKARARVKRGRSPAT